MKKTTKTTKPKKAKKEEKVFVPTFAYVESTLKPEIAKFGGTFGQEDLNKLVEKVNELVDRLNSMV